MDPLLKREQQNFEGKKLHNSTFIRRPCGGFVVCPPSLWQAESFLNAAPTLFYQ
jgi:hypothetical protein